MNDLNGLRRDADAALFYRREDPNDRRLGELVRTEPSAYRQATVVLLGCPQDEGVRRNGGRPGAGRAPAAIRAQLYRLGVRGLEGLELFDLGDTRVEGDLEAVHARHRSLVRRVLADGKRLIVLGGGNDVSYPDVSGLALEEPDLAAFNLDAHFDVRADTPRNSGTPYRQLLTEGHLDPGRFFEIGFQPYANSPEYAEYLAGLGVRCVSRRQVRERGVSDLLDDLLGVPAAALFWGLDMDVVRSADAPGVSAPNPTGLDASDVVELAAAAGGDGRSRLFEVSEVNPTVDLDDRTSRLAAVIVWHFIQAVQEGHR